MGNREDLLAGAKRCLYEKGYARTTARDVASASGVSLAAIGYHFGTTEALLNAAMVESIEEWGDALASTLTVSLDPTLPPLERFAAIWTQIIASFEEQRPVLVASFEAFSQIERSPEVRQSMANALQQGRTGLAALFQGIDAERDPHTAQVVGSFYQALMSGLIAQWLADPDRAPSGQDLADAVNIIVASARTTPDQSGA